MRYSRGAATAAGNSHPGQECILGFADILRRARGRQQHAQQAEITALRRRVDDLTAALRAASVPDTHPDVHEDAGAMSGAAAVASTLAAARHDLRQPLQAMRMFLYLLEQRLSDDTQRELAHKLEQALDATDALIGTALSPAAAGAPPPPAPLPVPPPAATGGGALVAVLEDDALQLAALENLLTEWGFQPVVATSPDDLLQALGDRHPALILSDHRLPGGRRGIDVIRDLRLRAGLGADQSTLPGLLLTGDKCPELVALADAANVRVLAKPLSPARLRTCISNTLAK